MPFYGSHLNKTDEAAFYIVDRSHNMQLAFLDVVSQKRAATDQLAAAVLDVASDDIVHFVNYRHYL